MAWYKLYRWFSSFRKSPYPDMNAYYKKVLFDEWYDGLTDEQKEQYVEYKQKKEESERKYFLECLNFLYSIPRIYNTDRW